MAVFSHILSRMRIDNDVSLRYTQNMNNATNQGKKRVDAYLKMLACLVILGLLGYGFAVVGSFSDWLINILTVALLGAMIMYLYRFLRDESIFTRVIFLISVAVSCIVLYGVEPFLFSGRDQGAIAEAALLLSETGSLRSSSEFSKVLFDIYGAGKALHYPGFHYTLSGGLITQFPVGTVAFFGVFATLFGTHGLVIASGLLLGLSLFTLFLLVRKLSDNRYAIGAFLIAGASFLPLFFSRLTLSENVFLLFFLGLSYTLIRFLRDPDRNTFLLALGAGALIAALRIEGVFTFVVTVAILVFSPSGKAFLSRMRAEFLLSSLIISLLFLALNLAANLPLYRSILGATFDHIVASPASDQTGATALLLWPLFVSYGLALPFGLGLIGIILLAVRRQWVALIPAFLALPAFLFFLDPNITPDHPWMLRRFLFSLWPTLIVSFSVALSIIFRDQSESKPSRVIPSLVFVVIFIASLPATQSLMTTHEYEGLREQTAVLAEKVGPNDLLLIDREASGDPYAIPAAPLRLMYDRHAVYFFNPADYAKLTLNRYESVYLLATPKTVESLWGDLPAVLMPVDTIRFSFDRLHPTPLSESRFPSRETVTTDADLYRVEPLAIPAPGVEILDTI